MRIAVLTVNKWFPREHIVYVLVRRLVERGHDVRVVHARPLHDLMLPAPVPEGVACEPPRALVEVARQSDVLWTFCAWPGQLHPLIKLVRTELADHCPPIVRYVDHALDPSPREGFLAAEGVVAPLVDRVQVLSDDVRCAYAAVAGEHDAAIDVLPSSFRSVAQNEQDNAAGAHPIYEIDRRTFGSIEGYNAWYGINFARGNRDALSIVESVVRGLERIGEGPTDAADVPLRFPSQRAGIVTVEQGGCTFFGRADDLVMHDMRSGGWEQQFLEAYFELVRSHRCEWLLDIGSHFGTYGVTAAKRYGLMVHMFEAQRRLAENAIANVHANDVADRARVYNVAVSDEEGSVSVVGDFGVLGRLQGGYAGPTTSVRCVALDSFLPGVMPVRDQRIAVKIDTEGHSHRVIAGMEALLRQNHCVLQVEKGPVPVVESLAALGYTMVRAVGNNQWFEPVETGRS